MTRPLEPNSDPDTVNVNFRMSERDRRDLKIWCVDLERFCFGTSGWRGMTTGLRLAKTLHRCRRTGRTYRLKGAQ